MEATSQAGIIHIATYVSKSLRLINTHCFIKSYDYCVFGDLKTHLETTIEYLPLNFEAQRMMNGEHSNN